MNTEQILTTLKQSGKLDVIKSIIDEALTEEKKDWNRRCEIGEQYWYFNGEEYYILIESLFNEQSNKNHHNSANYFPCSEYTEETLIADGVHRMGLTERWAYKFAKGNGYPWLTEEERMDANSKGYGVYFFATNKVFLVCSHTSYTNEKWFKHSKHAQLFCDWANEHLKPNGELK